MAHVRLAVLSAAAAATLALTACGGSSEAADEPAAASTVSIEHAQGTTEVPVDPETVFTFDLGALDTLDALGVDVAGVPQGTLPDQLSAYEGGDITNIGSMKEPDFEAIAAAAPDLIIISGRVADSYGELSEIAPTIDLSVDATDPIASFTEHTESLGRIFGAEDEVAERLGALDTRIAETKEAAASAGDGLILLTSAGEVTAYGTGSRFGLIHDVLGVEPAAAVKNEGTHGEGRLLRVHRRGQPCPPVRHRPRRRRRRSRRGRIRRPGQRTRQRHGRSEERRHHLPRLRELVPDRLRPEQPRRHGLRRR
ncbi:hypothetical protein MN0502_23960 [Arthrobacter sp. MN05-02]|nr:hypothetical protein MN0502_23960 [Arthrobacter sp. MN05-02]